VSMSDSGAADDSLHVAVVRHIGEAMRGWDVGTQGDSWVPEPSGEPRRDLPPLRLHEPQSQDR
jgi:hypothetical protein